MRRPLLVAVVLAVVALAVSAALDERDVAFETNLPAFDLVRNLAPGDRVCTSAFDVPADFQRVRLVVGGEIPAQPLRFELIDEATGRRRGGGDYPGGEPFAGGNVELAVGDVAAGGRLRACVTNEGDAEQRIFGSPPNRDAAQPPQFAVVFVADPRPTLLSMLPAVIERSALFKPGFYGSWTTVALFLVALLAVPFALSRALRAAYASERSNSRDGEADAASERSS
jgi:hypothetical protein